MTNTPLPLKPALKKEEIGIFNIDHNYQHFFVNVYNSTELYELNSLREQVFYVSNEVVDFTGKIKIWHYFSI